MCVLKTRGTHLEKDNGVGEGNLGLNWCSCPASPSLLSHFYEQLRDSPSLLVRKLAQVDYSYIWAWWLVPDPELWPFREAHLFLSPGLHLLEILQLIRPEYMCGTSDRKLRAECEVNQDQGLRQNRCSHGSRAVTTARALCWRGEVGGGDPEGLRVLGDTRAQLQRRLLAIWSDSDGFWCSIIQQLCGLTGSLMEWDECCFVCKTTPLIY